MSSKQRRAQANAHKVRERIRDELSTDAYSALEIPHHFWQKQLTQREHQRAITTEMDERLLKKIELQRSIIDQLNESGSWGARLDHLLSENKRFITALHALRTAPKNAPKHRQELRRQYESYLNEIREMFRNDIELARAWMMTSPPNLDEHTIDEHIAMLCSSDAYSGRAGNGYVWNPEKRDVEPYGDN